MTIQTIQKEKCLFDLHITPMTQSCGYIFICIDVCVYVFLYHCKTNAFFASSQILILTF